MTYTTRTGWKRPDLRVEHFLLVQSINNMLLFFHNRQVDRCVHNVWMYGRRTFVWVLFGRRHISSMKESIENIVDSVFPAWGLGLLSVGTCRISADSVPTQTSNHAEKRSAHSPVRKAIFIHGDYIVRGWGSLAVERSPCAHPNSFDSVVGHILDTFQRITKNILCNVIDLYKS